MRSVFNRGEGDNRRIIGDSLAVQFSYYSYCRIIAFNNYILIYQNFDKFVEKRKSDFVIF